MKSVSGSVGMKPKTTTKGVSSPTPIAKFHKHCKPSAPITNARGQSAKMRKKSAALARARVTAKAIGIAIMEGMLECMSKHKTGVVRGVDAAQVDDKHKTAIVRGVDAAQGDDKHKTAIVRGVGAAHSDDRGVHELGEEDDEDDDEDDDDDDEDESSSDGGD